MRAISRAAAAVTAAAVFSFMQVPLAGIAVSTPELTIPTAPEASNPEGRYSLSLPVLHGLRDDDAPGEVTIGGIYAEMNRMTDLYGSLDSLPPSFSLRDEGTMSPVRDQSGYGTCWAHSAVASAESWLFHTLPAVDLSEFHTAYYTYYNDPMTMYMTDKDILQIGGTADYIVNLWAHGTGPVSERVLPYGDLETLAAEKLTLSAGREYSLENAYLFDYSYERENEDEVNSLVKQFVYSGHAVDVSFCANSYLYYSTAYSSTNCDRPARFATHSVAIAGWDDSFPKENFRVQPENDGAWLVKNSWGSGYGDGGYIWISYEDRSLCEFAVYELGDAAEYDLSWHMGNYVPTQSLSAHSSDNTGEPSYMAGIYTAGENDQIGAIGIYTRQPDTSYEITIYSGLTDPADPASGTPSAVTRGEIALTGYHTLRLDDFVPVEEGLFGVVVKMYSPESDYVIPAECCIAVTNSETGEVTSLTSYSTYEQIINSISPGESFYSADGANWTDICGDDYHYTDEEEQILLDSVYRQLIEGISPDDANEMQSIDAVMKRYKTMFSEGETGAYMGHIPLDVYGDTEGKVIFSRDSGMVRDGETISLRAVGGGEIHYVDSSGTEMLYTEPLKIEQETEIMAFTREDMQVWKYYVPEKAPLISLSVLAGDSTDEAELTMPPADVISGEIGVMIDSDVTSIRIKAVSNGSITVDGQTAVSGEYTGDIDISGVDSITVTAAQDGFPDNEITLLLNRRYGVIDPETGIITIHGGYSATAEDGTLIESGSSVMDHAGETLIVYSSDGTEELDYIFVPQKADVSGLVIDYAGEALSGIPQELVNELEYAVTDEPTEEDWHSAEMRLIFAEEVGLAVIPGETISLRVRASEQHFAGETVVYNIPAAPAAPEKVPEYRLDGRDIIVTDERFEAAPKPEAYGHFVEAACDLYGYSDLEQFRELLSARYGAADSQELMDAMAIYWDDTARTGETATFRIKASDDSFASAILTAVLYAPGDVNQDGFVDSTDASDILVHYADTATGGSGTIAEELRGYADMDGSGIIDSADASMILTIYAALSTQTTQTVQE